MKNQSLRQNHGKERKGEDGKEGEGGREGEGGGRGGRGRDGPIDGTGIPPKSTGSRGIHIFLAVFVTIQLNFLSTNIVKGFVSKVVI